MKQRKGDSVSILDQTSIQGFIRLCNDGWLQGWHERNGGNCSYRMRDEEVEACKPYFRAEIGAWQAMGVQARALAQSYFIVTGSGKYFRNVVEQVEESIGIVEINEAGDSWRIVWGLNGDAKPTSEFPSHFMNHAVRMRSTVGKNRVIYHAHTPAIIALTFILPLSAKHFTRVLWQSATECPVVFPGGVGVVPWMVPGGPEIAEATSAVMSEFEAAVWAHHGIFCSGPDFDTTFGLMHTIEKAADIYLRVISSGQEIKQTITDDGLLAIASDFGVELKKEFLNL